MSLKHTPPAPRGQGEIDGSAHPAQADFNNSQGGYEHPSARPTHMYRTNIDNMCAIDIDSQSINIEKNERHVRFWDKAKESRSGGGNGIERRSGSGNRIGKEAEMDPLGSAGGGRGDEYIDQDVGKGRRIEEGGRNGGGLDSSEEFGGMTGNCEED